MIPLPALNKAFTGISLSLTFIAISSSLTFIGISFSLIVPQKIEDVFDEQIKSRSQQVAPGGSRPFP